MSASGGLRSGRGLQIVAAGLLALLAAGCTQGTETTPQTAAETLDRGPPKTASEVLDRVVEAYHQADRYQDAGQLLVRYTCDGETFNETREFSLAVAGPNRLRVRAYDALVVCDGQTFRATINEAPGEVLSLAAPEELSPVSVYQDQVLGKALNQIVGSVPLSLFLDPAPLPILLFNAQPPRLDPPQKIGDDNCYRVRIERREGDFVLWIDEQTFVVRRVEYPTGGCRGLLEPYPGAFTEMTITAEITDARLNPPIDDALFEFQAPRGAELVKRFDAVRVGARIPNFKLRALDGRQITRASLEDKIAVIKFWQKDDVLKYYHELSGFEQIQKRYQDQDSLVFLAVTADLDEITDEELQAAFADAQLSLPIARVARRVAFRSFGLQVVPATVIIGRDGTLQEHWVGPYPDQAAALPKKLDTLLAGGDLILEAPQKSPNYMFYAGFNWQNPQLTEQPRPMVAAALAKAKIAPSSEPERLLRKRLWACTELKQPGNILVVNDKTGSDRVLVIEGLPSVAEIDAKGKVKVKHPLELPDRDDAAVTFLRTAADAAGNRYFLGSKAGVQQLHLFDADWKRLLSYPESGDHPGIADALLADLDGDGQLEMAVGYRFAAGVHGVALDGQRLWRNRDAESVLRLDVTEPDRQGQRRLLVAQGWLLPIDADGRGRPPIAFADAFLRLIFTADLDGDAVAEWCAIALKSAAPGGPISDVALGLSPRGDVLWTYPLPAGTHQHADADMVASGSLLGGEAGQWVIAGADGSIHILASDGSLIDHFNYGAAPSGMAIARFDGRPVLLVSTDEAVEAWQFESPNGHSSPQ